MAITVFPTTHSRDTARQTNGRPPERLVRLSRSPSPYHIQSRDDAGHDPLGLYIAPVYQSDASYGLRMPGPSFSAQLLELGLKHNVDGLIQKAHEQLSYQGAQARSPQQSAAASYERAQDNFARDSLHMIERSY